MSDSNSISIKSRSASLKNVQLEVPTENTLTYKSVLEQISKSNKNINTNRLRLTYLKENKHVAIGPSDLNDVGKKHIFDSVDEWYVKDLGRQISWRLVFFIEYLGPILIHTVVYLLSLNASFRGKFHSTSVEYNDFFNKSIYRLILVHYLKREFETLFVHSFSSETMPLFNLFKNSFHYWVLNGLISLGYLGYGFPIANKTLYRVYTALKISDFRVLTAFFGLSELFNLYIHVQLRRWGDKQKSNGVVKRVPLNTGLFKIFVAPNYTFEIWAWIWFTLLFKLNLFSVLFLAVSIGQMYLWAQKKNARYGTKRAFLIPYLL
ncbi:unnamed protein product [Kluyveromyces dobzhanskii CBS 2104]|uniref:WGS project CCBQ000000000 data, contig MAT n=1 Tax=Kluyveromyces dobzhanskii CBS 2104 TaxID=1427455 RepID=A0A0A8L1V5_9SACH|nr:unnamed protein product [Kluyveromyces dobzhanskii CBS 2104]